MTTNDAALSRADAANFDIEEEPCDSCGYVDCRCDDDFYGDAFENGAKEEAGLE